MTKTERIHELLVNKGWVEVASPSRKYRKFTKAEITYFYWLGKAGALRRGRIASQTVSCQPRLD